MAVISENIGFDELPGDNDTHSPFPSRTMSSRRRENLLKRTRALLSWRHSISLHNLGWAWMDKPERKGPAIYLMVRTLLRCWRFRFRIRKNSDKFPWRIPDPWSSSANVNSYLFHWYANKTTHESKIPDIFHFYGKFGRIVHPTSSNEDIFPFS